MTPGSGLVIPLFGGDDLGRRLRSADRSVRSRAVAECLFGKHATQSVEKAAADIISDDAVGEEVRGDSLHVLARMKSWSNDEYVVAALRGVVRDGSKEYVIRLIGATALAKRAGSSATGEVMSPIDQVPPREYRLLGDVLHLLAAFCGAEAWEEVFECLSTCLAAVHGNKRDAMFTRGVQYLAMHAAPGSNELGRLAALVRASWPFLSEGERRWVIERWPGIRPDNKGAVGEPLRGALLEEARLGLVPVGQDYSPPTGYRAPWNDGEAPSPSEVFGLGRGDVEAKRVGDDRWTVEVELAEFVREPAVEVQFRAAIERALREVDGVTEVIEEDREVWMVSGAPSGVGLVEAVRRVLDAFVPEP